MMGMKSNQELNDVTGRKLLYRVYRKTHQQKLLDTVCDHNI